jgi:hypothetical protein
VPRLAQTSNRQVWMKGTVVGIKTRIRSFVLKLSVQFAKLARGIANSDP